GHFAPRKETIVASSQYPWTVALGDVNNDGKVDVVTTTYHYSPTGSGIVSVSLGLGDGTFGPPKEYSLLNHSWGASLADLNHDGFLDMVLSTHGGHSVSVFLNKGDGTFHGRVDYAVTPTVATHAVGDVNGDGNLDIVVTDVRAGFPTASLL